MPAGASPRVPRWAAGTSTSIAPPAQAPAERSFSITRKDGNDVKGPLDLASARISRGKTKDTVSFTGRGPISNGDLDINDGNLLILIDTNDAPPFEYGQYVFYAGGKLRGVLVNLGTNNIVDRTVPTSRSGSRGFRQVIQRAKIHSPGTYRFIARLVLPGLPLLGSSCVRRHDPQPIPSVDPARSPGAVLRLGQLGDLHRRCLRRSDLPVEFHVADDQYGTGVKEWIVQTRESGGGHSWTTVQDGKALNPTVFVPGVAGGTYDVRTIVVDRQNNRKISTSKRTTFPFDDDAAVYDPLVTQDEAATGWFLDTRSGISNAVAPGTATFTFAGGTGTEVCVMGGPVDSGTATADVSLDGVSQLPMTEDVSVLVHGRIQCYVTDNANPHTLLVTGSSASTFWIDGFYVVP